MAKMMLARSLLMVLLVRFSYADDYCFAEDDDPYLKFGPKTAYQFTAARHRPNDLYTEQRCTPIFFWMHMRSATTLPEQVTMRSLEKLPRVRDEILQNQARQGAERMCALDLEQLSRWQWNYTWAQPQREEITKQGKEDVIYLARRYQSRFFGLLSNLRLYNNFKFQYSNSAKSRDTFHAMTEGLFASKANTMRGSYLANDTLLRPDEFCPNRVVDTEPPQWKRFVDGAEFTKMVADVSQRLGYRYTQNWTKILDMYDMCRYEKAVYVNRQSVWCSAFTKDHLLVLEYMEDLRSYEESGYAKFSNERLGCNTVRDLYDRLRRAMDESSTDPQAVFYFGTERSLQLALTALGVFRDQVPLLATNYHKHKDRLWKTSRLTPFSGNLVVTLNRCEDEQRKYRVGMFINESPLPMEGCKVGICDWDLISEKLRDITSVCEEDPCSASSSVAATLALIVIGALAARF